MTAEADVLGVREDWLMGHPALMRYGRRKVMDALDALVVMGAVKRNPHGLHPGYYLSDVAVLYTMVLTLAEGWERG